MIAEILLRACQNRER